MFFSILLLAISSSMDSLGIGITYGLRKIKLEKRSKLVLFFTSMLVTLISIVTGNILKNIISEKYFKLIGPILLIFIGIIVLFKNDKNEYTFDLDNSNNIDIKEALILGMFLSLDSFCIGIGAILLDFNMLIFTITVACLQYVFLSIGNFLGIYLINLKKLPQNLWTKISGFFLIIIGLLKL